jgi:hypothetical protein
MQSLTPEQKFPWRDHVVLLLNEPELLAKCACPNQAAVEVWINDSVSFRQNTVIGQHRWSTPDHATEITRLGQARIDNVLQQWTD